MLFASGQHQRQSRESFSNHFNFFLQTSKTKVVGKGNIQRLGPVEDCVALCSIEGCRFNRQVYCEGSFSCFIEVGTICVLLCVQRASRMFFLVAAGMWWKIIVFFEFQGCKIVLPARTPKSFLSSHLEFGRIPSVMIRYPMVSSSFVRLSKR